MAWKAKELNVDRLAALVTASKLDLVLAGFFANDALARSLREDAWRTYQKTPDNSRRRYLGAVGPGQWGERMLREAQSLAVAHGEELELRDWAIMIESCLICPRRSAMCSELRPWVKQISSNVGSRNPRGT